MKTPAAKPLFETKSEHQITTARISPDGTVLATAGYEPRIRRWRITDKSLEPMSAIEGHHGYTTAAVFHPVQPWLFSSDSWGQLRCQTFADDVSKAVWQHDDAHDGWLRQIAVSSDGACIATCGRDRFVRVWSSADGKRIAEHQHSEDVYALAFAPDGRSLVFGDLRGRLETWDTGLKAKQRDFDASRLYKLDRIQDLCGLRTLLFIDGGKTLVASGTTPENGATPQSIPTILFFDVSNGKLLRTFTYGTNKEGFIHDLVAHPEGMLLAASSGTPGNGLIFALEPNAKEPYFTSNKLPNCHAIALYPDGKRMIVVSTNRDSNGNGRRLTKDGEYATNTSPLSVFELV